MTVGRVLGNIDGMLLLVPGDPLNERKPNEYFSAEAVAAQDLGLDVALVDHEALERGDGHGGWSGTTVR
jgi:hypothetical protein